MNEAYYFSGDYDEVEERQIELPIIQQIEDLQSAIKEQVDSMDKLISSNKKLVESYFLQNFSPKNGVYKHHSNEYALNSLSEAKMENNYCLQQNLILPRLLLLADQEKEDLEEEKINRFYLVNVNATVKRILIVIISCL